MDSKLAGHKILFGIEEPCKGFHFTQVGAIWAKKANNPLEGENCTSRVSEGIFDKLWEDRDS